MTDSGDVQNLPFKDNTADFTICNGVIHHTANPLQSFNELVRITKPEGYIYICVYNIWHPYYYIVHKATFPIRYIYWNKTKRIADVLYPIAKFIFQPLSKAIVGTALNDKTGRALFMDQVFTPRAHLFSKGKISSYADKNNCKVIVAKYVKKSTMISVIIKKGVNVI